jgi:hypothetical protein
MKRLSSPVQSFRSILAEYFELFLTAVGVLIAILITLSQLSHGEQGVALTFLIWLQGLILWAVHRHGWLMRRALFEKIRLMLQDRVDHRLTELRSIIGLNIRDLSDDRDGALAAARAVSMEIENLSFESLSSWARKGSQSPSVPSRKSQKESDRLA